MCYARMNRDVGEDVTNWQGGYKMPPAYAFEDREELWRM